MLSIGMIGLWFQCHSHTPIIRHQLRPFWANLDRRWTLSISPEWYRCVVCFAQNLAILEQSLLPHVYASNIRKNCLAWVELYANISSNHSSNSTIIRNQFLHCFNVLIGCWRVRANSTSIVIDIFSAFLKPVIPQLNLCSAHNWLTKCHSQYNKWLCTFNFFFFFLHKT